MNDRDSQLDQIQGWLLLAPFLYLCAFSPWDIFQRVLSSPFRDAPDAVSIGVGFMALSAIPALAVSLLRAWRNRDLESARTAIPVGLPLLLIPMALAAYHVQDSSDSFHAWRSLVGLVVAAAYVVLGSSLGQHGRQILRCGLPVGTLMLLASVALDEFWVGSLQNTGDLSEAALPGAVLGAGAFLAGTGAIAFLGFAALLTFAVFTGLSPVHAGTASLGAAALFALVSGALSKSGGENGRRAAAKRARLLLVAVLLGAICFAGNHVLRPSIAGDSTPEGTATATEATQDRTSESFGGFAFRKLTWARIPAVLSETGMDGAGPGQFAATFPPFRDPAEIELSSYGRADPTPRDVEHAHNDYATALVDYGWLGGGAFALFLLLMVWRGARAIGGDEKIRRDFGVAAIAIAANAFVNSPLLHSPLAAMPAFLVLGVVASPAPGHSSPAKAGVAAHAFVLACLVLVAGTASSFFAYGRSMAKIKEPYELLKGGHTEVGTARLKDVLDEALEHRPDAFTALEMKAQVLRRAPTAAPELFAVHDKLRALRPHNVAAQINSSAITARAGRFSEAREFLDAAVRLDPGNPEVLKNRVRLAFDLRDAEAFKDALDDLGTVRPLSTEFLRKYAYEALVGCRLDVAQPALDRFVLRTGQPDVDASDANSLFAASQYAEEAGQANMRRAYMSSFNSLMAIEHLRQELPGTATRNARQSYQRARDAGVDTGAARLIYAAALAADGETTEAEAALDEAPIRREDGDRMAPEVRGALESAGLLEPPAMGGR